MAEQTTDLTAEQEEAVQGFGLALRGIFESMAALEAVGLDPVTALRNLPGPEEVGGSMYEAMPLQIRMLLG
jgi:hypothetical protein